jgi:Fur family transcriptional regulator, ferric uptake regulator
MHLTFIIHWDSILNDNIFQQGLAMDLQDKLNQKGLRMTRPRQVVLSILEKAPIPLSPQTIYQHSLKTHQPIGLVTVYRTLDLLAEFDLVRRVHNHDECDGYVLASPGHHHHLICRNCNKAVEFTGSEDLSAIVQRVQRQTGYQVDDHLLELYGLCPACQEA